MFRNRVSFESQYNRVRNIQRFIIGSIIIIIISTFTLNICNDLNVNTVQATVKKLERQQLIGKNGTEYRYLIICDKELFVCHSSLINNKFDNSNLFFNLEEGVKYEFTVSGYGKGIIFDYRNILKAKKL